MVTRRAKVRMPKDKERKEKENNRKERKVSGKPGHLARDCWRNSTRVTDPIHFQEKVQ